MKIFTDWYLEFFSEFLILRYKVEGEFVSAFFGSLMHSINGFASKVMVEFVNDNKWIDQYVAV